MSSMDWPPSRLPTWSPATPSRHGTERGEGVWERGVLDQLQHGGALAVPAAAAGARAAAAVLGVSPQEYLKILAKEMYFRWFINYSPCYNLKCWFFRSGDLDYGQDRLDAWGKCGDEVKWSDKWSDTCDRINLAVQYYQWEVMKMRHDSKTAIG